MSRVKLAVTAAFMAVLLSACGIAPMPLAGTKNLTKQPGYKGAVDNPRVVHSMCLRQDGFKLHYYRTRGQRWWAIQVGKLPTGPTIVFYPTPGAAQFIQIEGQAQAAEVVGAALLYPNQASAKELAAVKACVAINVAG